MEIRQLEYFIAVSDCKNFTRASEKLFVSQPAITLAIASLESELGIKLFSRDKRNVKWTMEGKVFYNYAKKVLGEINKARVQMGVLKAQNSNVVKIAVSPMVFQSHFVPIYNEFLKTHKNASLNFVECKRAQALQLLKESGFNFAILAGDNSEFTIASLTITTGKMQLISKQPMHDKLSDLDVSRVLVVHDGDNGFNGEVINAIGNSQDIIIQKLLTICDCNELLNGDTVAIFPDWISVSSGLYTVPVEPEISASVLVLYNPDMESSVCNSFLDFIINNTSQI